MLLVDYMQSIHMLQALIALAHKQYPVYLRFYYSMSGIDAPVCL